MRSIALIRKAALPLALVLGSATVVGACGSEDSKADTTTTVAETTTTVASSGELEITGSWARTSPPSAQTGAAYFTLVNGTSDDDALTSVSVDKSVAGMAQIHETSAAGDHGTESTMGSDDHSAVTSLETVPHGPETTMAGGGTMTMHEVDEVPVPAGETVAFEPGGLHVMLMELTQPLQAGDKIELTLTFAKAGEVKVEVEVRDNAP